MARSAAEKLRRFYDQFSGNDSVLIVIGAELQHRTTGVEVLALRNAPFENSLYEATMLFNGLQDFFAHGPIIAGPEIGPYLRPKKRRFTPCQTYAASG